MERFDSIYLFTTENIAGYMNEIDLINKNIITVTGSSDHIINAILKGCKDITTFDINPLTKYYMDLKLAAIKYLSFNEFVSFFLLNDSKSFDYELFKKIIINKESQNFWNQKYNENNFNGKQLRNSKLFNTKYFDYQNKINSNLYLNQNNFDIIKKSLNNVKIHYINQNITSLKINKHYDYMFLSNISDYIEMLYDNNPLENYHKLINYFSKYINYVYFAYIYNYNKTIKRSIIDDISKVKTVFGTFKIKKFNTALINCEDNIVDSVLIKEENKNGK